MDDDDLWSPLIRDTNLQRQPLDLRALAPGRALVFPCERSVGLHLVLHGRVWLHAEGLAAPLALGAGDLALMARGCRHRLALSDTLQGLDEQAIVPALPETLAPATDEGSAATVVGGAWQVWHTPVHPFLADLPAWHVVRADTQAPDSPLALAVALARHETGPARPGRRIVLQGLLDLLFVHALRAALAEAPAPRQPGWTQAAQDPKIARVLARMHADCARAWTLEDLAREAGLSRTLLAERFRAALGDTPLNHLRTVRMQRAMHLLATTGQRLESVASAVGYQDAFAFSKVFKRMVGTSPAAFRKLDAAERAHPWRFPRQAGA
jgi:AraC-like DNA-binding protein